MRRRSKFVRRPAKIRTGKGPTQRKTHELDPSQREPVEVRRDAVLVLPYVPSPDPRLAVPSFAEDEQPRTPRDESVLPPRHARVRHRRAVPEVRREVARVLVDHGEAAGRVELDELDRRHRPAAGGGRAAAVPAGRPSHERAPRPCLGGRRAGRRPRRGEEGLPVLPAPRVVAAVLPSRAVSRSVAVPPVLVADRVHLAVDPGQSPDAPGQRRRRAVPVEVQPDRVRAGRARARGGGGGRRGRGRGEGPPPSRPRGDGGTDGGPALGPTHPPRPGAGGRRGEAAASRRRQEGQVRRPPPPPAGRGAVRRRRHLPSSSIVAPVVGLRGRLPIPPSFVSDVRSPLAFWIDRCPSLVGDPMRNSVRQIVPSPPLAFRTLADRDGRVFLGDVAWPPFCVSIAPVLSCPWCHVHHRFFFSAGSARSRFRPDRRRPVPSTFRRRPEESTAVDFRTELSRHKFV